MPDRQNDNINKINDINKINNNILTPGTLTHQSMFTTWLKVSIFNHAQPGIIIASQTSYYFVK